MSDTPNWLKKTLDAVGDGKGIVDARIYHDDWCKELKGTGECNCNPDIRMVRYDQGEE